MLGQLLPPQVQHFPQNLDPYHTRRGRLSSRSKSNGKAEKRLEGRPVARIKPRTLSEWGGRLTSREALSWHAWDGDDVRRRAPC